MVVIAMRPTSINWKYPGIENREWGWDSLPFKTDVLVLSPLGVVVRVFEISLLVNLSVFLFDFFVVLGIGLVVTIFFCSMTFWRLCRCCLWQNGIESICDSCRCFCAFVWGKCWTALSKYCKITRISRRGIYKHYKFYIRMKWKPIKSLSFYKKILIGLYMIWSDIIS